MPPFLLPAVVASRPRSAPSEARCLRTLLLAHLGAERGSYGLSGTHKGTFDALL